MNLGLQYNVVLAYIVGLILLFLLGWILIIPIKFLIKFLFNSIIGGIMLYILDAFGRFIGLTIGINPYTAVVAGFLGIPGIILMIILKYILT